MGRSDKRNKVINDEDEEEDSDDETSIHSAEEVQQTTSTPKRLRPSTSKGNDSEITNPETQMEILKLYVAKEGKNPEMSVNQTLYMGYARIVDKLPENAQTNVNQAIANIIFDAKRKEEEKDEEVHL